MEESELLFIAEKQGITTGQLRQIMLRRGLSGVMLKALPSAVVRRTLARLQYHDLPRAREDFRRAPSLDTSGQIVPQAMHQALQQDETFAKRQSQARVAGVPTGPTSTEGTPPPTARLNAAHTGWTSLGPGNIGGRIRSIVVDPKNSAPLWGGSVGGGVWGTPDGGANRQRGDGPRANRALSCM